MTDDSPPGMAAAGVSEAVGGRSGPWQRRSHLGLPHGHHPEQGEASGL